MWRWLACLVWATCLAGPLGAQQTAPGGPSATGDQQAARVEVQSPILTVDSLRLFAESQLGQQISAEIEEAGAALQAKNDAIATELEQEELELTRQRPSMAPDEFRALADAFDEKAQRIRSERAAELRALNQQLENERRAFLQAVVPILEDIMVEAGAAVVLEQRDVFLSNLAVDITALAVARIDASTSLPDAANE